jgi:predicted Zn-dependent protease with MMP-like domain
VYRVESEVFEDMVRRAVDELPPEFGDQLSNLEFSVEDTARPDDYARTGTPAGAVLLGVYRGVPLSRRGRGYNMALPDTIVVFKLPIERYATDEEDLYARIRHVVRHEVAHHFGISDERLREIDAY